MIEYDDSADIAFEEYVDFLKRTDLGSQYPKRDFSRVRTILEKTPVRIAARDSEGKLVGVCFGITDFVYFLFLTDLGVDRDYARQGIGKRLVALAHQTAGGEEDITLVTLSHPDALGFYEACGIKPNNCLTLKFCRQWEAFNVSQEY